MSLDLYKKLTEKLEEVKLKKQSVDKAKTALDIANSEWSASKSKLAELREAVDNALDDASNEAGIDKPTRNVRVSR